MATSVKGVFKNGKIEFVEQPPAQMPDSHVLVTFLQPTSVAQRPPHPMQAALREHLGRRPFRPFRVHFTAGDWIDVTQVAQGVATARQFMVGTPEDYMRRVPLEEVAHIEALDTASA